MVTRARGTLAVLGLLLLSAGGAGCIAPTEPGALVPPTVDEDPLLPQLSLHVAGRTRGVHLRTFGDPARPVLLLLHGSLSDHRQLLPLQVLSERYFVVMWDQRGNGLSERVTEDEYTWDSVVEEVAALQERFAPGRRVTLVGHSFGAMYAALYASRHPERVEQLALLEPGGLNGDIFTETYSDIIRVNLLEAGMNRAFWQSEALSAADHEQLDYKALQMLLNGKLTRYYCDPEHPPHLPVWRPGAHVEYLRGVRMGVSGFTGGTFDFDFAAGLDTFPRKVLLVGATCSALGPDFQARHHRPLFRDAEVATVEGAGHRLVVERPDAVLALLRGYLQEYAAAP